MSCSQFKSSQVSFRFIYLSMVHHSIVIHVSKIMSMSCRYWNFSDKGKQGFMSVFYPGLQLGKCAR